MSLAHGVNKKLAKSGILTSAANGFEFSYLQWNTLLFWPVVKLEQPATTPAQRHCNCVSTRLKSNLWWVDYVDCIALPGAEPTKRVRRRIDQFTIRLRL